jgi:hypothetical protein
VFCQPYVSLGTILTLPQQTSQFAASWVASQSSEFNQRNLPRLGSLDGRGDFWKLSSYQHPTIRAYCDNRNSPSGHILLSECLCRLSVVRQIQFVLQRLRVARSAGNSTLALPPFSLRDPKVRHEFRQAFPDRTKFASTYRFGSRQALRCELEHRIYLIECQTIEHFHDLTNGQSVLEIREYRCDWQARATKNPSTAEFSRHAFNCRALAPIQHFHLFTARQIS